MSPEGIGLSTQDERVESLRILLEHEQNRSISHDEASEVGDALICFFEVLANNGDADG